MSTHRLGVGLAVLLLMSFQQFLGKHREKLGNALFLYIPSPASHPKKQRPMESTHHKQGSEPYPGKSEADVL